MNCATILASTRYKRSIVSMADVCKRSICDLEHRCVSLLFTDRAFGFIGAEGSFLLDSFFFGSTSAGLKCSYDIQNVVYGDKENAEH